MKVVGSNRSPPVKFSVWQPTAGSGLLPKMIHTIVSLLREVKIYEMSDVSLRYKCKPTPVELK